MSVTETGIKLGILVGGEGDEVAGVDGVMGRIIDTQNLSPGECRLFGIADLLHHTF